MRKIILLLLLQCSLAAVGQEKPKIFFSNKTIDLGIIPSEKTPCVSVNFIFSNYTSKLLFMQANCICEMYYNSRDAIRKTARSVRRC